MQRDGGPPVRRHNQVPPGTSLAVAGRDNPDHASSDRQGIAAEHEALLRHLPERTRMTRLAPAMPPWTTEAEDRHP